jgi:hypothetical protein
MPMRGSGGQQKHALALECARVVLEQLWPRPFSLEQRYRYYQHARFPRIALTPPASFTYANTRRLPPHLTQAKTSIIRTQTGKTAGEGDSVLDGDVLPLHDDPLGLRRTPPGAVTYASTRLGPAQWAQAKTFSAKGRRSSPAPSTRGVRSWVGSTLAAVSAGPLASSCFGSAPT